MTTSIKMLKWDGGYHICEVARKIETLLPCPWPGCQHGTNGPYWIMIIEDDHAYAPWKQEKLTSTPPLIKREVYRRGKNAEGKFHWVFQREE